MSEKEIIRIINDPETNAATAPERRLHRPEINYFKALLFVCMHFVVAFSVALIWCFIDDKYGRSSFEHFAIRGFIITAALFIVTLRFSFIWFVKLYQRYAKSETRLKCCMTPSCSEYAILAFKKYGAIWGGIKTLIRLHRCHPPGGVDYP